jgi:two-component system, cell cycle response regulator CpdR
MARILLAEPDRAIREFIAGILTEFGHDVQMCDNVVDANVWLTTAPIDVLVTDMVLRDGQGPALRRCCAALGIPAITLTGWEFGAEEGGQTASSSLLEKPFRFSDLRRVLSAVESLRPGTAPHKGVSNAA